MQHKTLLSHHKQNGLTYHTVCLNINYTAVPQQTFVITLVLRNAKVQIRNLVFHLLLSFLFQVNCQLVCLGGNSTVGSRSSPSSSSLLWCLHCYVSSLGFSFKGDLLAGCLTRGVGRLTTPLSRFVLPMYVTLVTSAYLSDLTIPSHSTVELSTINSAELTIRQTPKKRGRLGSRVARRRANWSSLAD